MVDQEIYNLLEKGAVRKARHEKGQVLSSLFLREKKDGSQRPILNLKKLNTFIPYCHFKMETLKNVRDLLMKGDLMVKIDLKDAYFTLPLHQESRKYVRFRWEGTIYEFLCLCFGLGPAPRLFTKLLKVPMAMLRRINIRLVIYLDDILIMGATMEEIEWARDTVLYLLINLGFVINWVKSVLHPTKIMEYLGVVIDSDEMSMFLTEEKTLSLTALCQDTLTSGNLTLKELESLIGKLADHFS